MNWRLILAGVVLGLAAAGFWISAERFGVVNTIFGMMMLGCLIFIVVIGVLGIIYEANGDGKEHWSSRLQRESRQRSHRGSSRRSSSGGSGGIGSYSDSTDYGASLD